MARIITSVNIFSNLKIQILSFFSNNHMKNSKELSLFEYLLFQLTLRLSEKDHIKSESVLMFKKPHVFEVKLNLLERQMR
jgi:hypothetical protein